MIDNGADFFSGEKLTTRSSSFRVTRGNGLLESFLADLRTEMANKLIPESHRQGRVLDIGCGAYPHFLTHTTFAEKYSIDQQQPSQTFNDINWTVLDLNKEQCLPYEDAYFNIITLLAVMEHLHPKILVKLFQETYRMLKPEGFLILTTPASWSEGLLNRMTFFNLVSKEEIHEHVLTYTLPQLGWYFGAAGFPLDKVQFGYFELKMNLWATAQK